MKVGDLSTIWSLFPTEIDLTLCLEGLQLVLWGTITQNTSNKIKLIINTKNLNDIINTFQFLCKRN